MAGKKPPMSNTEPRLGGLRIQTSLYGQTIPVVFGRARIPLNLVWFGGFKATRQEEQSEASKGGGSRPSRIYYSYSAHVLGLLGEGPITAVRTVYKGKQKFVGETIAATAGSDTLDAAVPGSSPYQVSIGGTWSADVGVAIRSSPESYPPTDVPLVPGLDYTVAAGVYTFAAALAGRTVRIAYTTSTAGSSLDALGQIGLALVPGTPSQPTWTLLAQQFAAEAIPYSGFAYVRGQDYPLTSAAEVENHGFEVDGFLGATANGDAWPDEVIREVLTNPAFSGAQWSSSRLGDWTAFRQYCEAYGLAISPAFLEQRATRDWLQDILDSLNTDAAWTGSVLKLIPRGDENAGSYVAPITPVFNLGPDDLLADEGEPALRLLRSGQSDAHNVVRVEFANRAKDYNLEPQAAEDEVSIVTYGRREESTQSWHWFADGFAARMAAFLRLQRKQAVRAQWEGRLPWRFAELEPGDLVTLTDPAHLLSLWPARVVSIEENGDDFDCVFEDFPIGHATAPVVQSQLGSGFRPDFNAPPGDVVAPLIFEPPGGYTQNGLEVWAAVSGPSGTPGQYWGGAEVYASLDGGASYKLVGRVDQGARYGTLSASLAAGAGATLSVALAGRGGQFRSVSSAEADALATLAFVGSPATGEFLAFESATLSGANAYNLTGLRRGRYGTNDQAAASGASFVFVDGALGMSGPLPPEMIGKEIRFKFCSFNVFGGGLQQLADVTEYAYTITGRFRSSGGVTSANLVRGAALDTITGDWTTFEIGIPAGASRFEKWPDPLGVVGGGVPGVTPSSAVLLIDSALTGDGLAGAVQCVQWSVRPGDRQVGYAGLIGYGTNAYVGIAWYSATGAFLNRVDLSNVIAGGVLPAAGYWNRPEAYVLAKVFATAPPGAALARLIVYGSGGWQAVPTKAVSVYQPFGGTIAGGLDDVPAWDPGGHNAARAESLPAGTAVQEAEVDSPAGLTFPYSTIQIAFMALASMTAVVDGVVEITITMTVRASIGSGSGDVFVGILQANKLPLVARQVFALTATNKAGVMPVTLTASMRVSKGDLINPVLRMERSRFGLGVGNTTDAAFDIVGRVRLVKG